MSEMQEIAYTDQPEEFTVTDDATAQWCVKKIREAEETKEKTVETTEAAEAVQEG